MVRKSALILLVFGMTACAEDAVVEKVLRPVRSQVVTTSDAARVRSFAGVARAGLESLLSFRVSGTVLGIPVSVGTSVAKGQTLARLDPTDYELRVQEAVAGLAQAKAAERNAEADYERVRGLYENNNASLRELDGARATAESSQAQVEAAEKRLEQARQQLSYCTLRAPADGQIAAVDVDINENVQSGQGLILLTAGSDIDVEVSLPGALIADIKSGQEVTVAFDALPDQRFPARVTEAGVAAVGSSTTFPVTVRLAESDPAIRSGMAAEVQLSFRSDDSAGRMLVPAVAVGEDRDGRYVFILQSGSTDRGVVHRRQVTVGELTSDGIEILGGIDEGERIVTAGVRRLSDGEEVKIEP